MNHFTYTLIPFLFTLLSALWFGGNTPLATHLIAATGTLAGAWALAMPAPATSRLPNNIILLLAPAALMLLWGLVQILPLYDSPLTHPLWAQTASILGTSVTPTISLTPHKGYDTLLYGLGLMGLTLAAARMAKANPSAILQGAAWGGFLICLYGLITYAMGNQYVLHTPKYVYGTSLTGTFIGRNNFATFAGLTTLACLAMALERIGEIPSSTRARAKERFRAILNLIFLPRWHWFLMSGIAMLTLVLSTSRAGLACTFLGAILMLGSLGSTKRGWKSWVGGLLLFTLTASVLFSAVGQNVSQRLETVDSDMSARNIIYQTTWQAIQDTPLLGTGLGSFEPTYRMYRTPDMPLALSERVDHAHNTTLELWLELGFVGFAGAAATLALLLSTYLQGLNTRRRGIIYPALGLGAVTLVFLHSLVDFSLEMPGVAVFTLLLLSLAAVHSTRENKEESTESPPTLPHRLISTAAAAFFTCATALLLWQSVQSSQLEAPTAQLASLRRSLYKGETTLETQTNQLQTLREAFQPHSQSPHAARELTFLSMALAQINPNPTARASLYNEAHTHARHSLTHNPADAETWHRLAQLETLKGNLPAAAKAFMTGLFTAPWDPTLARGRLPLLVTLQPYLQPEDRELTQSLLKQLWQADHFRTWKVIKTHPAVIALLTETIADDPTLTKHLQRYLRWKK